MTLSDELFEDANDGEREGAGDPWRWYRIGAGVLTAIVGLYAGAAILVVAFWVLGFLALFAVIFGGATSFSGLDDIGSMFFLVAAISFVVFGQAGLRFAMDGKSGRVFVWIAALLSLPVRIYTIWVLIRTWPGSNQAPPQTRLALGAIGVVAVVIFGGAGLEGGQYLREKWANQQRQDNAFIETISPDRQDELRALLEAGEDPNQITRLGTTPLMIALDDIRRLREHAALLLEHGADPNAPSWFQREAEYRELVSSKQNEEGLARWVDLEKVIRSYRKHTPVAIAARLGETETVRLLIEKGADVNARQNYQNLEMPLVDSLKSSGGVLERLGEKTIHEPSALDFAIYGHHAETVALLLAHGATVDRDILARAPFHLFGSSTDPNTLKVVRALLEHGASANPSTVSGFETPLMAATRNGHRDMVKLLIEHGADRDQAIGR